MSHRPLVWPVGRAQCTIMDQNPHPHPAMQRIGLVGLGHMGAAMAKRMLAEGHPLLVWNRSQQAVDMAKARGAHATATAAELFSLSETILLVLATAEAADGVLGRRGTRLDVDVAGRLVIQLGTTMPEHSQILGEAVAMNGGRYVEAPVSGSRLPAEQGRLIAMLGGSAEEDLAKAETVLSCLTSKRVRVGSPPHAMRMKLAVNALLVPFATALSEAWGLAEAMEIDMILFTRILNDGPMSSDFLRMKLDKLLAGDLSAQASINDVRMNARLIGQAAQGSGARCQLVGTCESLLLHAQQAGRGPLDIVAVSDAAR